MYMIEIRQASIKREYKYNDTCPYIYFKKVHLSDRSNMMDKFVSYKSKGQLGEQILRVVIIDDEKVSLHLLKG